MREHVEHRWEGADKLLQAAPKTRNALHLKVIRDIAAERFGFPTEQHPTFRTFVNEPEPTMVVEMGEDRLTPDIVVMDSAKRNAVRLLAEVETADSVDEDHGRREWLPYSRVADANFFLYVPAGHAEETKRILRKLHVKRVRLRTWRYVTGLDKLDITDVRYGPPGLDALVPPFLLRRR
jgi:hypothetical protein